ENVSEYAAEGAQTGAPLALHLKRAGAEQALVGHSERRTVVDAATGRRIRVAGKGESHDAIVKKMKAALAQGLHVVLAIGETWDEREAGKTEAALAEQLAEEYGKLTPDEQANVDLAYEPVWAIGKGATPATPAQAQAAHRFIRLQLASLAG